MARKVAKKKTAAKKKTTSRAKSTGRKATRSTRAKSASKTKKKTATRAKAKTTSRTAKTTRTATTKAAAPAKLPKSRRATKPRNGQTLAYTQSEFLDNIKEFCGLPKKAEAKEIWEDISAFITDSLKKGYRIPLVGLGKMYVRKSKARMGRNPATGEMIHIAAKKRVRFTPAKALKDSVL